MELNAILSESLEFLKSKSILFPEMQLYLFGSAKNNPHIFNDIDILVIYETNFIFDAFYQELKKFQFYPLIHLTCLTINEDKELNFIFNQNAMKLDIEDIKGIN